MDHNEFDRKCRKMAELKQKKKDLDAESKEVGNEITSLTIELHEAYEKLEKAGPVAFKDLGKKLVFKEAIRASVRKEENDDFLEWLDAEGLGDLAKRAVDWRNLAKLCEEREENGDEMPVGVDIYRQKQIALNAL